MKAEALVYVLVAVSAAGFGNARLPVEQALFLWSIAGTVAGSVVSSLGMKTGNGWARTARACLSFFAGLLIAPWAIAGLPRAEITPEWWHAFAASGVGASIAYIVVAEAPALVRGGLRQWRGLPPLTED